MMSAAQKARALRAVEQYVDETWRTGRVLFHQNPSDMTAQQERRAWSQVLKRAAELMEKTGFGKGHTLQIRLDERSTRIRRGGKGKRRTTVWAYRIQLWHPIRK